MDEDLFSVFTEPPPSSAAAAPAISSSAAAAPADPAEARGRKRDYSAAADVAQAEDDDAATRRLAKRVRKEQAAAATTTTPDAPTAAAAADAPPAPTGRMEFVPLQAANSAGGTVQREATTSCVHEVAVPEGFAYVPFSEGAPFPTKMAKEYKFTLDPFQRQSVWCIERNESVMVSAHTSAGKTVVAEYAIATCLRQKQRVIYTTPIKALSNQKFREFTEEFHDVGLMTGDVTINPAASCLIMTTEILRSMLYRGSEIMREVGWVVFDEIHYMRDKERGVVWEETIILLPHNVHFVFLSATIPNALQFAKWVAELHAQPCHVVYTDYRPTPLQHYVFPGGGDGLHLVVDELGNFKEEVFLKAMASLGDSQQNQAKENRSLGRKGGQKGPSDCFKIVKMVMERSMQPVIIFSFSKRDCETHAMQMSKLDFTSDEEKGLIDEIFSNAMESLSEDDRRLPQVENVLPLLRRGIGIHHGGLLPILKEVIEILFGEGLVKALFATETFAMGLNMPAKTVVFTGSRKFDGKDFRHVSSGEYIQMSGRAGRRGLDDRGIVILMMEEKMESETAKNLLKGKADTLNSAFHISYNMVLNNLRVEGISPEDILHKSFFHFQTNASRPEMEGKLAQLTAERGALVIPDEELASEFYDIKQQLQSLAVELQQYITAPENCLKFLTMGRLIKVRDGTTDWGWGAVVNFQKKPNPTRGKGGLKGDTIYVVDVLLHCSTAQKGVTDKPLPVEPGEQGELVVVPVLLPLIERFSAVRLRFPDDLRPSDARRSVLKSIHEVQRRFPDGLPPLDPIKDMGISSPELSVTVTRLEAMEKRYFEHPLRKHPDSTAIMALCEHKEKLSASIRAIKKELKQTTGSTQLAELKCRKRVLRRLNFCTSEDVVTLKGKVACEISSGDELVLTEMIFHNIFTELDVNQCVAVLSCFVFDEKSKDTPKMSDDLTRALRQLHDTARRVAKVCNECNLPTDEEEYVASFKSEMMVVTHAWASGCKFSELCKMTDIFEGSIIRTMRRLEEMLRQMCAAAKAIGNTELENKFAEGITRIKRDIIFAASLYL